MNPDLHKTSYEELLDYARDLLTQKYGSPHAFTNHEDFGKVFGFQAKEQRTVLTYLSKPGEGKSPLKSVPFLNRVLGPLVGVKCSTEREVVHRSYFYTDKPLPPLPLAA